MKTEFLLLGIAQARFGFNPGAYSYRNVFEKKNFQAIFIIKKYKKHVFDMHKASNIFLDANDA